MSKKHIIITSAIVIGLLGIFTIYKINISNKKALQDKKNYVYDFNFKSVDDIWKIEIINKFGQKTFLKRLNNNDWIAGEKGIPASKIYVNYLLTAFTKINKSTLISDKPSSHIFYGVTKNKLEKTLVLYDKNDQLLDIILVGDILKKKLLTFIRKDGSNNIYLIPSDLYREVSANPLFYFDKNIFTLQPETIASLKFTYPDKNLKYTLARDENGIWTVKSPVEAKAKLYRINKILSSLRSLNCIDLDTSSNTNYNPLYEWNIELEDKTSHTIHLITQDRMFYHIKVKGRNFIYAVRKDLFDWLVINNDNDIISSN